MDVRVGLCRKLSTKEVVLLVKNLPANAGDVRDKGSIPGLGRSPGEVHGNPLQYSCLENHMNRGPWWVTVHGVTKSLHNWATSAFILLTYSVSQELELRIIPLAILLSHLWRRFYRRQPRPKLNFVFCVVTINQEIEADSDWFPLLWLLAQYLSQEPI